MGRFLFVLIGCALLAGACKKQVPIALQAQISIPEAFEIKSITPVSEYEWYVCMGKARNEGRVYHTTNGGNTWNLLLQNIEPECYYDLQFDANGQVIVGSEWLHHYLSADSGKSWDTIIWESWMPLGLASFQRIKPLPSGGLVAVTGDYHVGGGIATRDSLGNWSYMQLDRKMTGITYSGNTMYASGYSLVLKSTDIGQTWDTLNLRDDYFKDIYAFDPLHVVLITHNGKVMVSEDGGENWEITHRSSILDEHRLNVMLFKEDMGYAVGNDGLIIRSQDQGLSWVRMDAGINQNITAISQTPSGNLILGIENGELIVLPN